MPDTGCRSGDGDHSSAQLAGCQTDTRRIEGSRAHHLSCHRFYRKALGNRPRDKDTAARQARIVRDNGSNRVIEKSGKRF